LYLIGIYGLIYFVKIKNICVGLLILTLGSAWSFPSARADIIQIVVKKNEEKEKSRWSLAQWLETRDRMRLMDLWLALHTPSPYEFYFGLDYRLDGPTGAGITLQFGAFASIFGLHLERFGEKSDVFAYPGSTLTGLFKLRLFGYQNQGTNWTLETGYQSEANQSGSFRNFVLGSSLTVYLARFLGVDFLYRYALPPGATAMGTEYGGHRIEGGLFLDYAFFRIFGKYQHFIRNFPTSGTSDTAGGLALGFKILF
jgi:hypothetical protein